MKQTEYASAERTDEKGIQAQSKLLQEKFSLDGILDSIPQILMILNPDRQIVYANQQLLDFFGMDDAQVTFGKRPGEIFNCIHSFESEGGCGTTEFCRECGAVNAILDAQKGAQSIRECRILTQGQEALDLRVWARPYSFQGLDFTIFTVTDIANEKRREALERTFFHDILNTAGNILGASSLLKDEATEIKTDLREIIQNNSTRLVGEIRSQQMLLEAEKGILTVHPQQLETQALLTKVMQGYSRSQFARKKELKLGSDSVDMVINSDEALLGRILGNLLKNALEATADFETITLSASKVGDEVHFTVHNPNHMPRPVELQVFQRSFSTKGAGRGIGTYSIKLFAERYLGGRVWFNTDVDAGTTFTVALPVDRK